MRCALFLSEILINVRNNPVREVHYYDCILGRGDGMSSLANNSGDCLGMGRGSGEEPLPGMQRGLGSIPGIPS